MKMNADFNPAVAAKKLLRGSPAALATLMPPAGATPIARW